MQPTHRDRDDDASSKHEKRSTMLKSMCSLCSVFLFSRVYAFDADTASGPESPREHWSLLPSAGGVSEAHGDLFLRTSIQALACEMLDNFEASIKKLPHTADLRSPLDASSAAASSSQSGGISPSEAQARAKKVRGGRQKKYIGDYCLLAADPAGALKQSVATVQACASREPDAAERHYRRRQI